MPNITLLQHHDLRAKRRSHSNLVGDSISAAQRRSTRSMKSRCWQLLQGANNNSVPLMTPRIAPGLPQGVVGLDE
jgi:hypothetical protein